MRTRLCGAVSEFEGVKGTAILHQANDADAELVTITLTVEGLPVGSYGLHIHQFGDISSAFPMGQ